MRRCGFLLSFLSLFIFIQGITYGQIVLLSPTGDGGFETGATFAANGWTVVNPPNPNSGRSAWEIGAGAVPFAGTSGIYTINNTVGTWAYQTNAARASHFYRDIPIPAGATNIELSFYWKGAGELNFDRALVYTAPTTTTPVGNVAVPVGATNVWTQPVVQAPPTYTLATIPLPNGLAGTTVRLIFTWQNDGSLGALPGSAIDNIKLSYIAAAACSGSPNSGTALISASSGCPSANFTLSATGLTTDTGVTYQWQSASSAAGPWTNIVGANAATFVTSATATTYYQLVTTCANSGISSISNTVVYTVAGGSCSCGPYALNFATSTADEDITNVTVGAMNNPSVCGALAPGAGSVAFRYSNYTGSVAGPTGVQGSVIPFSLSMTTCGGNYTNFFQIYIDWNQDGDFADVGEQAYSQAAAVNGNQTAVGNFTIPATALVGTTRMRVINVEAAASTTNYASAAYTYGETEDYCFTVTAGASCAGTPNAGTALISSTTGCPSVEFNLSASGLTFGSGITYQWQSSPTGLAGSWVNIPGANAANFATSATVNTFYQLVTTCSNSGSANVTNAVSYTINCNDLICSATPISCGQTLSGTTIGATLTGTGEVANACGGTATQPGVWYSVVGNGQIMIASLCGTATWDSRIQVFSGANCNTITCVGGNDDFGPACAANAASYQWTSIVGVNYYILVSGFSASSAFNLELACTAPPTPPANDLICNATAVTCGQSVNGTTVNATPTGTGEGQACGGFTQNQPGVWYSIVGSGSNINASLCASAWDSRIQVFTGANCNTVTCVGGNDNNGPLCAGNAASYSWLAANGQTYYVLVSGATATTSAFTLSMACQTPCTASCNGGPPPANDACGGAQNLGAVPTPAACPNGVGAPVNFNTTNVCATAEPNYTSLLGCQPAGNQAAPAADVWYRFTIVAPILNVTINGLGTPNVALYEGTNCANLVPRGCSIGSGGFLNTQFQGLAPGSYYLQVSGGDVLDQCTFTLTLQNNYDCAGCVLAANLDATPPPVNGQYQPGTLVTFCYTVTSYQQTSANWLHGIIPTFGPGWDLATFAPLPTTTVNGATGSSCSTGGTWSWYNTNITSSATGAVTGPGFYYETAAGGPPIDGNPGNNFGDANPGTCRWTFCWQIRTKQITQCVQDQSLNMTINTTGDGESGSWTSLACTQDPLVNFFAQSNCCPTPTVTVTNPTCAVPTGSAVGQGLGTSPWTYVWKNAAGVTLLTNTNTAGTSTITGLAAGDYTLTVTDATGCTSFIAFSIVAPAVNTVTIPSANPTLCVNTPLTAITFSTTGATGIGAAAQLPAGVTASFSGNATAGTITLSGTPTASGIFNYSIPLTGGCGNIIASGTITVNANMTATSTAPNATVCQNQALSPNIVFTTTGATGIGAVNLPAGLVANFTGNATAGAVTISGTPTSTVGSPFAYSVALSGGCGTVNAAGTITINSAPAVPTASTTSLCAGLSGTFSVSGAVGATLSWTTSTGGSGVTPSIPAIGSVSFGPTSFSLGSTWPAGVTITFTQISLNGCNTPLNIVVTVVSTSITASVTATSPICSGSTSTLTFTGTPSALVTYTIGTGAAQLVNLGPTGTTQVNTSALTANTIVNVTQAQVGSTCIQPLNNAFTIVVNTPTVPIFNPIGPYCYSTTAPALPATSTNSVSGTWSPATINTNIVGVTNYTFTPTGTCPASPVLVPVTINPLPTVYAHGTNPTCSTLCNGSAVVDITNGTAPYSVNWSNGGNTASITNLCEGTYNVTVTDANGCVSQAFTPVSGCFQILSIGVDACGLGTEEGRNEMFTMQVGTAPLNLLSATVTWPANSFTNFNCSNAAFIAAANAGITAGGVILPIPAGGILPANATVVIMTSNVPTIDPATTFSNVSDTLYMAFHCSSTLPGYFANGSGSGTRTLSMTFGSGCTDAVTYDIGPLVDSDGAYVNFSQSGTPTYLDYDCVAPYSVQDNSVVLDAPDPVIPTFNPVGPYCSGSTIPALPTSSTNVPPITGTWTPAISNTTTTTYTFTPTTGLCATTAPLTITINALTVPTFNPIAQLCYGATPIPTLPTTSINSITGTWSPPVISNTASGNYIFTPNPNQCASPANLNVTVAPQVVLDGIYHD